jgi:hypothetical protein
MAGTVACVSRTAWAQGVDSAKLERTLRSLRIWWNNLTREPDEGDEEAKDTVRFVSPVRPNPRAAP